MKAEVIKRFPDNRFEVKFDNGRTIKAKTVKRFRKLVSGDRVIVKLSLRDLDNGQIVGFAK